jgi:hypothetical protein
MQTSETTLKIDNAILQLQANVEPVSKNAKVAVELKTGGGYSSAFATYAVLYAAVGAQLIEQRISFTQFGGFVQGAGERLFTRLAHEGEWIIGDFPIKESRPGAQGFGGGISFARRWSLLCALGLVLVDDSDEKQGYQDQRAPSKAKQRAPIGIADAIQAIREARSGNDLQAAVSRARAAYPTEAAVEKALSGWMVAKLDAVPTVDFLIVLKDLQATVHARGLEVREALNRAGERLEGGK